MDMKKILQALDGAAAKPVEGANDMKKFVSIIQEGANPHKVSLPVQMAMQHYQAPVVQKPAREPVIGKFFKQVEDEIIQEKAERRQLINQYASVIAERVMMKEGKGDYVPPKEADYGPEYQAMVKRVGQKAKAQQQTKQQKNNEDFNPNVSPNPGFAPGPGGPGLQSNVAEDNQPDVVALDIPLLIRLFEYAREDAKTDMDLHDVAERLIAMSETGQTLSMADYDKIVGAEESVAEGKKIKPKKKTNPCWDGYQQLGMKAKGGKQVPNCVKK
jgi:hypothetical protein